MGGYGVFPVVILHIKWFSLDNIDENWKNIQVNFNTIPSSKMKKKSVEVYLNLLGLFRIIRIKVQQKLRILD